MLAVAVAFAIVVFVSGFLLQLESSVFFSAVSSRRRSGCCSQYFLVWQAIHCFPSRQSMLTRVPSLPDSVFRPWFSAFGSICCSVSPTAFLAEFSL
jgi:hypothetical protein